MSKQETIVIDGVEYDPYYILQVTKNDTDDQISKAYRKRAKRYHPDKAPIDKLQEYSIKFKIVSEAYKYIKNKRTSCTIRPTISQSEFDIKVGCPIKSIDNPNSFGYGEQQRLQKIEDYDNFSVKPNTLSNKQFDIEEFNKLFENNTNNNKQNDIKAIVHKTTDGFYGYNTNSAGENHAMVHTYNGLMVTGDEYGQTGVGYWGNGYSDYRQVFNGGACEGEKDSGDNGEPIECPKDFKSQEEYLRKKTLEELVAQEEQDKAFVTKYSSQYDPKFISAAMNGELEKSTTLLDNLKDYYNTKLIKN